MRVIKPKRCMCYLPVKTQPIETSRPLLLLHSYLPRVEPWERYLSRGEILKRIEDREWDKLGFNRSPRSCSAAIDPMPIPLWHAQNYWQVRARDP